MHVFLASALVECEWSASRPGRYNPGERAPYTHCVGRWVGPKASLDDVEKRRFLNLWEPPTLIQALANHSLGAILC
jgi:hypothetical protein